MLPGGDPCPATAGQSAARRRVVPGRHEELCAVRRHLRPSAAAALLPELTDLGVLEPSRAARDDGGRSREDRVAASSRRRSPTLQSGGAAAAAADGAAGLGAG